MIITTSYSPGNQEIKEAEELATQFCVRFVKREDCSLLTLLHQHHEPDVIVISKNGWRYENQDGMIFTFHPNLSLLRIKQLREGNADSLVSVSGLEAGDRFLDCTLGMGADAIVSSYVVGEAGQVVGLESEPVLATLVKKGLQTYHNTRPELDQAMRSIEVVNQNHDNYLRQLPDHSFDVVYFDPMFRQTVVRSAAMQSIRPLANPSPLTLASVQEAKRVARKAVVFKERRRSGEFERLGFSIVKEASSYAWGVIR